MGKKEIGLRIIFMGTSIFAETILETLVKNRFNVISVFTKPDAKAGRKNELVQTPVKKYAQENNIKVYDPEKLDAQVAQEIKKMKPDMIIVAAYGKIIPKEILDMPGFGCINIHASLLPKFRGASPIQNALMCGEKETGVSIILMDKGIDTGDILLQNKITIKKDQNAQELSADLARLGSEMLIKLMPLWIEKKAEKVLHVIIEPIKQDDTKATLCQLIERSDGKIIWEDEAVNIFNRFRALYPWPGIYCYWEKDGSLVRIKLLKIGIIQKDPESKHKTGEVFEIGDKIGVQTMRGVITLDELQIESGNPLKIKDFTNGYPNFIGSILR